MAMGPCYHSTTGMVTTSIGRLRSTSLGKPGNHPAPVHLMLHPPVTSGETCAILSNGVHQMHANLLR
jgi:hypothetical protein